MQEVCPCNKELLLKLGLSKLCESNQYLAGAGHMADRQVMGGQVERK